MEHQQAPLSAPLTSLRGIASQWRRIELALDRPTEDGDTTLWLWSNLPEAVTAGRIAELYRMRWHIEGMFGRLESVLHSEISSLGQAWFRIRPFWVTQGVRKSPAAGDRISVGRVFCAGSGEPPRVKLVGAEAVPSLTG